MDFKWYISPWVLIMGNFEHMERMKEHSSGPVLPCVVES